MQRRRHRQYGLSNANQVLLAVVVAALLFLALLRRHWLGLSGDAGAEGEAAAEVNAGLWAIYVSAGNDTQSVSWSTFCGANHTLPMCVAFSIELLLRQCECLTGKTGRWASASP